ncbi:E3 ubiquitin-protein ligase ORTHRUS 2 [Zea mays]|uniref:E3 ubiquitin-protein ligase ORTHRUS 2 n=1 Tax=Zea mays TaxID=4577 RepID=A0A1D6ENS8_MAIZE|nr:E3 ubiquitin-protein ligase ORTHRUS 2 [Zea mays]
MIYGNFVSDSKGTEDCFRSTEKCFCFMF